MISRADRYFPQHVARVFVEYGAIGKGPTPRELRKNLPSNCDFASKAVIFLENIAATLDLVCVLPFAHDRDTRGSLQPGARRQEIQ